MNFLDHHTYPDTQRAGVRIIEAEVTENDRKITIEGSGTGPVDGFLDALNKHLKLDIQVIDYSEHTLRPGADASAVCYMEVESGGQRLFGVGINKNIVAASLEALVSAANRILAAG